MAVLEPAKSRRANVKNPGDFRRNTETISVPLKKLPDSPVVMDGLTSRILDSQVIGKELLFQVDLAPGETRHYLLLPATAVAATPQPIIKTFARFVPERKDDFAWESDRIAFRVYGPALMTDPNESLTSSGVDVWVKRTRDLVINGWYTSGDYHTDHGEGVDYYKVGPTRGCGGLGVWDGETLHVSQNYKTQRVIATGPVRSVFELTFDTWDANGRDVTEVKRLSIDANSNFTRSESVFTSNSRKPLRIGVGIVEREGEAGIGQDDQLGFLAYWEPESPPNGNTGCAVILPHGVEEFTKDGTHLLAIGEAKPGKPFVYHFGAAWNRSGDFESPEAAEDYVRNFAERLGAPLKVSIGR